MTTVVKEYPGFTLVIEYHPDIDAMTTFVRMLLEGAARRKAEAAAASAAEQHAG